MHELSIATALLEHCRDEQRAHDGARIERAAVVIGELAGVERELLLHAWEAILAGTPDEGAVLEIDWRPARQRCGLCGEVEERQPGTWLRLCPTCDSPLEVEGGDELDLVELVLIPREAGPAREPERSRCTP